MAKRKHDKAADYFEAAYDAALAYDRAIDADANWHEGDAAAAIHQDRHAAKLADNLGYHDLARLHSGRAAELQHELDEFLREETGSS